MLEALNEESEASCGLLSLSSSGQYDHRPPRRIGFAEMARRVSKTWNELDPDTKETYQRLADQDKMRYLREKQVYHERKNAKSAPT